MEVALWYRSRIILPSLNPEPKPLEGESAKTILSYTTDQQGKEHKTEQRGLSHSHDRMNFIAYIASWIKRGTRVVRGRERWRTCLPYRLRCFPMAVGIDCLTSCPRVVVTQVSQPLTAYRQACVIKRWWWTSRSWPWANKLMQSISALCVWVCVYLSVNVEGGVKSKRGIHKGPSLSLGKAS